MGESRNDNPGDRQRGVIQYGYGIDRRHTPDKELHRHGEGSRQQTGLYGDGLGIGFVEKNAGLVGYKGNQRDSPWVPVQNLLHHARCQADGITAVADVFAAGDAGQLGGQGVDGVGFGHSGYLAKRMTPWAVPPTASTLTASSGARMNTSTDTMAVMTFGVNPMMPRFGCAVCV